MINWRVAGLWVLLSGAVVACQAQTGVSLPAPAEVRVGLQALQKSFSAAETMSVQYTIKNDSDSVFTFLPWGTPLEKPMTADCFDVFFNNQRLPYIGLMVKRVAPTQSDYQSLQSGQSAQAMVDLSRAYDMSVAGTYAVQLKTTDGVYRIGADTLKLATGPVEIVRVSQ